jgi:hypothetical protein
MSRSSWLLRRVSGPDVVGCPAARLRRPSDDRFAWFLAGGVTSSAQLFLVSRVIARETKNSFDYANATCQPWPPPRRDAGHRGLRARQLPRALKHRKKLPHVQVRPAVPAGLSGNSSRPPTAPLRSRSAGRLALPPIPSPPTSARPSTSSTATTDLRTRMAQLRTSEDSEASPGDGIRSYDDRGFSSGAVLRARSCGDSPPPRRESSWWLG